MWIRTVVIEIVLCFYCSAFVVGQLQTSLKAISGNTTSKHDDSHNKLLSQSTFRRELDDGNQSIAQQSFPLIAEYETRRLSTTQVNYLCLFFPILAFLLFHPFYCMIITCASIFCVMCDLLLILDFSFYFMNLMNRLIVLWLLLAIIVQMCSTSSRRLQARGHRVLVVMVEQLLLLNCVIPEG